MKKIFSLLIITIACCREPAFAMLPDEDNPHTTCTKASTWDFLTKGDTIEFIAPSKAVSDEIVEAVKTLIENHELKAYLAPEAINPSESRNNYYANSDQERANYFMAALQGHSKVLWALRGGFGAAEVVTMVENSHFSPPLKPTLIVGFSDVTALHLLADRWGWCSLHAPNAAFGKDFVSINKTETMNKDVDHSQLLNILKGKISELEYSFEIIWAGKTIKEKPIHASVMGGNTGIIETHNGTPTALRGDNRFVFLEQIVRDPETLHRSLISLLRSGVFDKAKGIIFGNSPLKDFENSEQKTKDFFRNFVKEYLVEQRGIDIPAVYSSRFGHGNHNDVMPLGTSASLILYEDRAILKVSVNEPANTLESR